MLSNIISSFRIFNLCSASKSSLDAVSPAPHMSLEERIKTDGCTEENLSELMNSADGNALFDDPTIQCILVKALLHGTNMNERVIDKLKTCHPNISSKDQAECILSEEWRITDTVEKGHPFIFRFFIGKLNMFSEINQELLLKEILNTEGNLSELMNSADGDALFNDPTIQCILVKALLHGTSMNKCVIDKLKTCHPNISSKDQAECIKAEEWSIADVVKNEHPFLFRFFIGKLDMFSDKNQEVLLEKILNSENFSADIPTQRSIATAIYEERFTNKEKALQIIAEALHVFTDEEATKYLQLEIDELKLNTSPFTPNTATIYEENLIVYQYGDEPGRSPKYEYDYGYAYESYELEQARQNSFFKKSS